MDLHFSIQYLFPQRMEGKLLALIQWGKLKTSVFWELKASQNPPWPSFRKCPGCLCSDADQAVSPCCPQGKPIDFVDVNEGNTRWIQDFRMKSYASPAKLESIDGKSVTTALPGTQGLLRARILGKNDTGEAGKLCFNSCSCWFAFYLRGSPSKCFAVLLFILEWSFSFNVYVMYTNNVCVVY